MKRASASSRVAPPRPALTSRRRPEPEPSWRRVLVVDDDPFVLRDARAQLAHSWKVDTAPGAMAALELISQHDYDVVVTDYAMPGRDGIWLLDWVKRKRPATGRVMLSGDAPEVFVRHITSGLVQRFHPKAHGLDVLHESLAALA